MDTHLSKCLPLKVTGKLRVSIKDKDNVTIAKNLYLPDAVYIVEMVNKCAKLEARLKEAEAVIKPLAEHDAKWAGVGEVAIFLAPEHYARAAEFLKGAA